LSDLLQKSGKAAGTFRDWPKSASWKVEIAREMKKKTSATNQWLADQLVMGHASRVSALVHGHQQVSKKA